MGRKSRKIGEQVAASYREGLASGLERLDTELLRASLNHAMRHAPVNGVPCCDCPPDIQRRWRGERRLRIPLQYVRAVRGRLHWARRRFVRWLEWQVGR